MPFLLFSVGNMFAFVAALLVANVTTFLRARGADAKTGDSKYLALRFEFAIASVLQPGNNFSTLRRFQCTLVSMCVQ